jgi:hypothetical protein
MEVPSIRDPNSTWYKNTQKSDFPVRCTHINARVQDHKGLGQHDITKESHKSPVSNANEMEICELLDKKLKQLL